MKPWTGGNEDPIAQVRGQIAEVKTTDFRVVAQFESSHLTIAMEAWKPASLKAMPPQSNTL
jgi:hypothetical protein